MKDADPGPRARRARTFLAVFVLATPPQVFPADIDTRDWRPQQVGGSTQRTLVSVTRQKIGVVYIHDPKREVGTQLRGSPPVLPRARR